MKSITKQKPFEEIQQSLDGMDRVYIAGCGTCATMTKTGGRDEVLHMKDGLQGLGKIVTGWSVIPVACDEMTDTSFKESANGIRNANCLLVMSCALGVQRLATYIDRPVIPALDTLFIGLEKAPGDFHEVCAQCGHCVIGETAGVCPITSCHKRLLNGPCGGTNNGKCEVDRNKDCAWTTIYDRLKAQSRLDLMKRYRPLNNAHAMPRPRIIRIA